MLILVVDVLMIRGDELIIGGEFRLGRADMDIIDGAVFHVADDVANCVGCVRLSLEDEELVGRDRGASFTMTSWERLRTGS